MCFAPGGPSQFCTDGLSLCMSPCWPFMTVCANTLPFARGECGLNTPKHHDCCCGCRRFWRKFGIRFLYLVMLIVCALIVSALSTRTRVNLDRQNLEWVNSVMAVDIGRAGNTLPSGRTLSCLGQCPHRPCLLAIAA